MKRKKIVAVILVLAFVLSLGTSVGATELGKANELVSESAGVLVSGDANNYVMRGPNETTLLVKSITNSEYSELLATLYPNGVVDAQGQEMGGIANIEEVRAQFIDNRMKAYSVSDNKQSEIQLKPFTIELENQSVGEYDALFYSASIGQDTFVFPSEWGNQPYGFTHMSNKNVYLAFTDKGIWQIDPIEQIATKITSDTYLGKTQAELSLTLRKENPNSYLLWIDNVAISPAGDYIVFRTNRDADNPDETSVWKVNLKSNSERRILSPNINNDIVGFISDNAIVVGSLSNTRIANLDSGNCKPVDVPLLQNVCVKGVKDGKVVVTSYQDGSTITTAYINQVNLDTGEMTELSRVSGYLSGEPEFSPSGNKIALGYGSDAMTGINDVVIVDAISKTHSRVSESLLTAQSANPISSNVTRYLWLNEDTVLTNVQKEQMAMPVASVPENRASAYQVVFGNTPPTIVNFISPLSTTSTSGFVGVNSKWNQPRASGTNPHNGVDLQAALNTNVYAPYAGWATGINVTGNYDIKFLVDANKNTVQDDGDYYIRFYHMNARESNGYKTQGQLIGKSGNQGGYPAHLHFGICSETGGLKWLRNEVNYRYLTSNNWASGQDLDIYSQVRWNDNKPSIIAYIRNDGAKQSFGFCQ